MRRARSQTGPRPDAVGPPDPASACPTTRRPSRASPSTCPRPKSRGVPDRSRPGGTLGGVTPGSVGPAPHPRVASPRGTTSRRTSGSRPRPGLLQVRLRRAHRVVASTAAPRWHRRTRYRNPCRLCRRETQVLREGVVLSTYGWGWEVVSLLLLIIPFTLATNELRREGSASARAGSKSGPGA